eukprot:SAG31_NODE_2450_length_5668_cov_32.512300_7_plen_199_part_01
MLTSGVVSSHYLCSSFLLHASDKTGFLNEEQICSLLEKIIYPPLDCEETEDALQDMELRLHGHVKFECFLNWYTNESLVAAGDDCEETGPTTGTDKAADGDDSDNPDHSEEAEAAAVRIQAFVRRQQMNNTSRILQRQSVQHAGTWTQRNQTADRIPANALCPSTARLAELQRRRRQLHSENPAPWTPSTPSASEVEVT